MKIIVTHNAPDWDAVTSAWILKRFLPGWNQAVVEFVPAGERLASRKLASSLKDQKLNAIEKIGDDEVIHVDTGMGPLDHHQTPDQNVSAASLCFDYVLKKNSALAREEDKKEALERIVRVVVETDHFKELFWDNPTADYHEFSLLGVLEGVKIEKPGDDTYAINFGFECLDALIRNFENRIWAEKEIAQSPHKFETRYGHGIGFEIINDTVLKLAQKMGYALVVRKDPRKGYVRVKAKPSLKSQNEIDLTNVYEQLKKMDSEASWYLHVSKKMLLNGTPKNPEMVPTKLSLRQIIDVLKQI